MLSVLSWTVTVNCQGDLLTEADSSCQSVTGRSKFVDPIDVNYSLQTFEIFIEATLKSAVGIAYFSFISSITNDHRTQPYDRMVI